MKERIYGTMEFGDKIDITDPCYDRDVWCRISDFQIPAGTYECYTVEASDKETHGWGTRVAKIGIRKQKIKTNHHTYKGFIGVDAGLAGFFNNKPDYTDKEWKKFVDRIYDDNAWIIDDGFYSSSGYGDGEYNVYADYKDGELVNLFIKFI